MQPKTMGALPRIIEPEKSRGTESQRLQTVGLVYSNSTSDLETSILVS